MEIKTIKLADIKPAPYNPRKKLKPGDEEYKALKGSIERFGLVEPLILNMRTGLLIGGHQRLTILKEMGVAETEVVLVDVDENNEKLLNIALNKIEGQWNHEKLEALFEEFTAPEITITGFTEGELKTLFEIDIKEIKQGLDETGSNSDFNDSSDDEISDEGGNKDEFMVYLSFPSKEAAEDWLEKNDLKREFIGSSRNIVIGMEGAECGNTED